MPPELKAGSVLLLEEFLPYRLLRAAEEVSRRFARHYKDRHEMTRPEWRTLATIGQFERLTAKEVGQHSSMHKTKVSRAVRALEQRRWLKRTTDEADRRIEHLELSAAGRRIYTELVSVAESFERDMTSRLGDDAARALDLGLGAVEKFIQPPPR